MIENLRIMKISRTSEFKPKKKVELGAPAVRFDRRSVKGKYRRRIYTPFHLRSPPLPSSLGGTP